jgi:hypothetical protein
MAVNEIERSPVSLMSAACKAILGDQLSPPLVATSGLSTADANGLTPLATAVRNRQTDVVKMLLDLKAAPDVSDSKGNTPLILAAGGANSAEQRHIVMNLLRAKASVSAQNHSGHLALSLASNGEVREMLQAEMDRCAVQKQISKSCSLPAIKQTRPKAAAAAAAAHTKPSKAKGCRVRLQGLASRASAEELEEEVRSLLEDCGVKSLRDVEIGMDPITQQTQGLAFLDFATMDQAEKALQCLAANMEENLCVSIEQGNV